MTTQDARAVPDTYTIRRFEPGDETDFVALCNEACSTAKTTDWFD